MFNTFNLKIRERKRGRGCVVLNVLILTLNYHTFSQRQ
jgi:hypothetical protein